MDTIKECFHAILHGGKDQSRKAARQVRQLAYRSSNANKDKYEDITSTIRSAPETYETISEGWRQENFVTAVSVIYFLHGREERPDFLFPWLLRLLEQPNGYIRHAAVKMFRIEMGPLTVHIRFPGQKSLFHDFALEEADPILYTLVADLEALLVKYDQPKYKYVDSLPPSPYKSVQMVIANLKDLCTERYRDPLESLELPRDFDDS